MVVYLRAWMQPRVWAAIHVILQVVSVWATFAPFRYLLA